MSLYGNPTARQEGDVTPPDQWAHTHLAQSQTCPMCLGPVTGQDTRKNERVMLARYGCAMGHRWNLTWVLGQVTA